jgi:hypothetical protein
LAGHSKLFYINYLDRCDRHVTALDSAFTTKTSSLPTLISCTMTEHFFGEVFLCQQQSNVLVASHQLGGPTAPGFPTVSDGGYRKFSLAYTHSFNSHLLNQAQVAFHRSDGWF